MWLVIYRVGGVLVEKQQLVTSPQPGQLLHGKTYVIHDFCIVLSQNHVHGVHQRGVLQSVWVLPVLLFANNLHGFLVLLRFQGAQWEPSNALHEVSVVCLVLILPERKIKQWSEEIKSPQSMNVCVTGRHFHVFSTCSI